MRKTAQAFKSLARTAVGQTAVDRTVAVPEGAAAPQTANGSTGPAARPHPDGLDPAELVARFPGPAVWLSLAGDCLAANAAADPVVAALADGELDVDGLAARAAGGIGARVKLSLDQEVASAILDLAVVPAGGDTLMLLGRDVSLEETLSQALIRSRELFRDLIACSADFGWETDASGAFTYVSPSGALGHEAVELNGRAAHEVFAPEASEPGDLIPFHTRERLTMADYWVHDRDGNATCLWISAVPIRDAEGRWQGARGVCRDVTADRRRQAADRLTHARQSLLAKIILAVRDGSSAGDMLATAAAASAEALRAETGWLVQRRRDILEVVGNYHASEADVPDGALLATLAGRPEWRDGTDPVVQIPFDGHHLLVAFIARGRSFSGALALRRDTELSPWRDHEFGLIAGVMDHLAIALEQAAMVERLETLSRVDPLTGLTNRRAFQDEVNRRIVHQRRSGRPACFLYIDLDNFKQVNDRWGHARGDAVLRCVAELLSEGSRAGDIAGRLGGDEFALWLEDTDLDGAMAKARRLIEQAPALREAAGDDTLPLSLSVGVAQSIPDAYPNSDLLADAADRALYDAKDAGRGDVRVAPPPESVAPPAATGQPAPEEDC